MITSVSIPIITSMKNSGGPKLRAIWAKSGARRVMSTTPTVPPTNEAIACMTRAGPARPFCASG